MTTSSGNGEIALEACLSAVSREIRPVLEACLHGKPLSWQDGVTLSSARGRDLHALCLVADQMRIEQAGDVVTYVVNRNINFTNVCVKNCKFCAFSRDLRSEQAYFLDTEEIIRRAKQARAMGATEVCIQAGLAPSAEGRIYIDICRAVKETVPELHLHAFSPEEVKYGAVRARMSIREYLAELKDAGLGSLPGTSAEILDDAMRERISPGRITTKQWIEVVTAAHELGLPTSSTMMFGHVESAADRMRHMDLLRSIQADTGGFSEFVPLSFVHEEAPMFAEHEIPGVATRAVGRRRRRAVRHRPPNARADLSQYPGLVGQRGPAHVAVVALMRRQRPRRYAHEREHLDIGRLQTRPARHACGSAPRHPRRRPNPGRAQHALRNLAPLRRRRRAGRRPRAARSDRRQ